MRNLVLWGHDLNDYREMFNLNEEDLQAHIIEYGSGASSFNVEMLQKGQKITSCDELFKLPLAQLCRHFEDDYQNMLHEVTQAQNSFNWSKYGDLTQLSLKRRQGMQRFFDDYSQGQHDGRYVAYPISKLPFNDFEFELALSSHYLFANVPQQALEFHCHAIKELARVAHEVRIFPLINRKGNISDILGPVMMVLQQHHYGVELRAVPYSLQANGNAMLRVWAHECKLTADKLT